MTPGVLGEEGQRDMNIHQLEAGCPAVAPFLYIAPPPGSLVKRAHYFTTQLRNAVYRACVFARLLFECVLNTTTYPAGLTLAQEREERVSQLKEKSALLKASGTSAQGEAEAVRELLAAATEELEDAKTSSGALGARLGTLEKECRDAQIAQESLRCGQCFECWRKGLGGHVEGERRGRYSSSRCMLVFIHF